MGKYVQTLSRVGLGLTLVGTIILLLWPSDLSFLNQPKTILSVLAALVTWILAEIKTSEEFVPRRSSPNDIRVAERLLRLYANSFRTLLKDHDLRQFLDDDYFLSMRELINDKSVGALIFQNRKLELMLEEFISQLRELDMFVSVNTTPEIIAGRSRTGFKTLEYVPNDEYERLSLLGEQANDLASRAWIGLENLIKEVHRHIPEALDNPIKIQS